MMSFNEFVSSVSDTVVENLMYRHPEMEFSDVKIQKVNKGNGIEMTGMAMISNSSISPNLYLEPYYEMYKGNEDLSAIISTITNDYSEAMQRTPKINSEKISDADYIKRNAFIKVINCDKNKEYLTNAVFSRNNDLALSVRVLVSQDEAGMGSFLLTKDHIEKLGMSSSEIIDIAKKNTEIIFPSKTENLSDYMKKIMIKNGVSEEMADAMLPPEELPITIVTNDVGVNGATAIFYDGLLDEISEKNNGQDLYILPSSVHECLIVPENDKMDAQSLKEMVEEVNSNVVSDADYLSDSVYKYNAKTKEIELADNENTKGKDDYVM